VSTTAPPSLEEVYRQHVDFVWRAVRRFGVPAEHAEDAVQDVFMIVQRKLPEFRGDAALTTWLYAIARGVVSNQRRSASRAAKRLDAVERPPAPETPEDSARRNQAAALVAEFIEGLDADKRDVFVLCDVEGVPGPQAAEAIGISTNLLHSRLRTARLKFRQCLQDAGLKTESP
jgi:RNA polymerase sigma-70 factor (ECF subfamily)